MSDQCGKIREPATDNIQNISHDPPIPLLVPITPKPIYMDDYIDDITVTFFINCHLERAKQAVPLAIHTIFRPIVTDGFITRDPTISMRNLVGEGQLSTTKEILG